MCLYKNPYEYLLKNHFSCHYIYQTHKYASYPIRADRVLTLICLLYYLAGYDPGQVLDMYKQRILNTGIYQYGSYLPYNETFRNKHGAKLHVLSKLVKERLQADY